MLAIYNRSRQKVALLENAFNVVEQQTINQIFTLRFTLPETDPKNAYCNPYWYVQCQSRLYRIMPATRVEGETGGITYECEHVVATLLDSVMTGYNVVGNLGVNTSASINYVLARQRQRDWALGTCDFARFFEYGWEQENLLNALFSIPSPVTTEYIWTYDTSVYPWKISLKAVNINNNPDVYIRKKLNQLTLTKSIDPRQICTRLYCYGAGEGVNQIRLSGTGYLQSPQSYIDRYGIIERIWIDRRYQSEETLRAAGETMLAELQEPLVEYTVGFSGEAELGQIVQLDDGYRSYITGIAINYDDESQNTITIANKPKSVAGTVAELADRQRIETAYSQGATQIYAQSVQGDADTNNGMDLNFYIDDDMIFVNRVLLKIKTSRFRAYSQATAGGGSSTPTSGPSSRKTTLDGGSSTPTSGSSSRKTTLDGGSNTPTSGPSSRKTTLDGGSNTPTSNPDTKKTTDDGGSIYDTTLGGGYVYKLTLDQTEESTENGDFGSYEGETGVERKPTGEPQSAHHVHDYDVDLIDHTHGIPHQHHFEIPNHDHKIEVEAHHHGMKHTHTVPIPDHNHGMDHTHTVPIPNHNHGMDHTHTVPIPAHSHGMEHTHDIELPDHIHAVTPGIFFFGGASSFTIFINDVQYETFNSSGAELDITNLLIGANGKISRGAWQKISVVPNALAYITIDINIKGFIQSHTGGNY